MEYVFSIAAGLVILAALLLLYFNRKKTPPSAADNHMADEERVMETVESEPEPEADPYVDLMPHVSEVQNDEAVKRHYRRIEVPAILKSDILKTLASGAMVVRDSKTYKVEFSPDVVKGLKDRSMALIERANGKGYLPAVKKEGVSGIYKQAVLVKNVNPALVVHASTNLLTAVVGQQQLVEIQTSLKSMEEKLTTLIQHRDNDFFGSIESRFTYFKEIIGRFRANGISLGGVEDQKIEDFYAATLQDLKVLNKDLKDIGGRIDRLKEHETIRKWGEAAVIKDYRQLIEAFNSKQELVLLNIKFIEECYEPYLIAIRNLQGEAPKSLTLDEIVADNDNIISSIETKVKNIEENYKVKMNFGVKALKYRNLESLKEVTPLKINQQKTAAKEIPTELLFVISDDEKVYAYVPEKGR
ncbi:hypothetical protein G159_02095 [Planococcus glaciei CHR43]|uniref:hypothetical protein n=1 Tax=Planococcus glaciei TaxID=459472 RepID=UPI0003DF2610|nr:hypothetical protein [Planococcus glaciei]ETP70342.1 hypothetical protein G159_02095 [Planococcus glaciei CHR43]